MGTTLTGTTPQDTYDSLIKVTDNGPLSGSLKTLTDGLGNDSALALSTGAASITGTLAVSGNVDSNGTTISVNSTSYPKLRLNDTNVGGGIFYWQSIVGKLRLVDEVAGAERLTVDSAGNVGIGTSSPNTKLQVNESNATATLRIKGGLNEITSIGQISSQLDFASNDTSVFETDGVAGRIALVNEAPNGANVGLGFYTYTQPTFSEKVRITSTGILSLNQGQIQFPATQVASADPNTLDDYEEGTFTPSVAFGGASTGITYFDRVGVYTKIGRQVTCTIYVALTNVGSATGDATLDGLPFTNGNVNRGSQSAGSIRFDNITYGGSIMLYVPNSSTSILFAQVSEAGTDSRLTNANFNNDSEISITVTYFV